jgi:hypothetical protein
MICNIFFCGQKVYQVDKHITSSVLSMGTMLSCRVVYEWTEMFKNGHTSVTDAEHSGCSTTASSAQNEEIARELILQNRRVMINKTVKQLNIGIGYAYFVVHENFQFD